MDTDNAWAVQERLEDFYFSKNNVVNATQKKLPRTLQSIHDAVLSLIHKRGAEGIEKCLIANYSHSFSSLPVKQRHEMLNDMIFQEEIFVIKNKMPSGQWSKRVVHRAFTLHKEKMMLLAKADNKQVVKDYQERIENAIREIFDESTSKAFDNVFGDPTKVVLSVEEHTDLLDKVKKLEQIGLLLA